MEKLIVASKNKGKIAEVRQILQGLYEIVPMEEIGITADVEETGTTFEENARIKARYVYEQTGLAALSDDSGLCVDALGGAPGVYSARYAGEHGREGENNALLLKNLAGVENRTARFVSAVALVSAKGEWVATGKVEGKILYAPEGNNGFGYDPLFYCTEIGKPFGIATAEEKNAVSHRARALLALEALLKNQTL
ncbi:MAG: RdgB/HAM1 family non-canonical purine NTP pyrophosphatase [Clostridiales bacterium]|nr:RdgB/HAM1 family non-canonical purine NTP pyrophosphatase [Clostridiales bacterium]